MLLVNVNHSKKCDSKKLFTNLQLSSDCPSNKSFISSFVNSCCVVNIGSTSCAKNEYTNIFKKILKNVCMENKYCLLSISISFSIPYISLILEDTSVKSVACSSSPYITPNTLSHSSNNIFTLLLNELDVVSILFLRF